MNSVRERVLREIVTRLASAIAPTPVLRMPAVPVTREASPALLLFVDGDSITAHANHLVDRVLIVRFDRLMSEFAIGATELGNLGTANSGLTQNYATAVNITNTAVGSTWTVRT